MALICPTVLATDMHDFRQQMERVALFAKRVQIDLADGEFANPPTIKLEEIWWPKGVKADIHLMYKHPHSVVETIIRLNPNMLIVHAESESYPHELIDKLKKADIKLGLALLPKTDVESIQNWLSMFDHLLIFKI